MPRAEPGDLPGQAYGSLRSAWKAYEIAVQDDDEQGAKQAACVINGIRAGHGMDPLEFDSLGGFVCDDFLAEAIRGGCPFDSSTLEKLPKGSSCVDWKAVPAVSDYWKDGTTKVTRCGNWNTTGDGDGTAPPGGDDPPDGDGGGGGGDGGDDGEDRKDLPKRVAGYKLESHSDSKAFWVGARYDDAPAGVPREGELSTVVTIMNHGGRYDHRWSARVKWKWPDGEEQQSLATGRRQNETANFNRVLESAVEWMEDNPTQEYREAEDDGAGPIDPPREVNGWNLKRTKEDLVDYSAPYYEGLPTGDLKDGTDPHEVAEVMIRTIETESRKFPNRWTARVMVWNENDENVYETPIKQAVSYDDATRNRNDALEAAMDWMEDHEPTTAPDPPEEDDGEEDDADDDPAEWPEFSIEIENGRLREVLEPFKRLPRASGVGHFDVDGAAIDFVGMDRGNVTTYKSSLFLSAADSSSVESEGETVEFPAESLANAAGGIKMGEPATLECAGGTLTYSAAGVEKEYDLEATVDAKPSFPDASMKESVDDVTAKRFKLSVRGISKVYDDSVAFVVDDDEAYLVAENAGGDTARASLTEDDEKIRNVDERQATLFSYDYLREISLSPYAPKSSDVRFDFYDVEGDAESEPYDPEPVKISYEQRGGIVQFALAPRMVTDKANKSAADWDLSNPCPFAQDGATALSQPEAGDDLPDVDGLDFEGDTVLWAFPNTEGCRCGAQALQYEKLAAEHGVNVYALAASPPDELQAMADRLDLEHVTFVSDPGGNLAEAFEIEQDGDGNLERTTLFVRDGTVTDVSEGVPMVEAPDPGTCPFERPTALSQAEEDQLLAAMDHPGVYVVTGARGSGKSALAHQLGEQLHERENITAVTVGQPKHVREHYPGHWVHVDSVKDAPPDSVLILDEAYMQFHARDAMDDANKAMGARVNTSRHCNQTMVFVSQNSRHLDTFAVGEADGLLMKEPGQFHKKFERSKIRDMTETAEQAFGQLPSSMNEQQFVYAWTNDLEGMVENDYPDWYDDTVSKSYGSACSAD